MPFIEMGKIKRGDRVEGDSKLSVRHLLDLHVEGIPQESNG